MEHPKNPPLSRFARVLFLQLPQQPRQRGLFEEDLTPLRQQLQGSTPSQRLTAASARELREATWVFERGGWFSFWNQKGKPQFLRPPKFDAYPGCKPLCPLKRIQRLGETKTECVPKATSFGALLSVRAFCLPAWGLRLQVGLKAIVEV